MWQSLIHSLGAPQGDVVRGLGAAMRAGGSGIVALTFTLGALPALTHGDGAHALTAGIGLLPCPLTIRFSGSHGHKATRSR